MSNFRIVFNTALLFCLAVSAPLDENAMDGGPGTDVDAPHNDGGTMYMALPEGKSPKNRFKWESRLVPGRKLLKCSGCMGDAGITAGSTDLVTEQIIKYYDNSSTDDQLCFRLHKLPDFGHLYQDEADAFHKKLLKTGDVFCQKDIHDHHISYSAPDSNEANPLPKSVFLVFDAFDFSSNTLANQTVTISIASVNQM